MSRELAVQVITRVLSDRLPLDEVLERESARIPEDRRGWVLDVTAGVMRWRGRLDEAIDSVALKKKPTGWLRKVLWVGAYQLLAQERAPAGKVVSETVDLVRSREGEGPAKFANAVLRRLSEHAQDWRDVTVGAGLSLEQEARRASLPTWLWKRLKSERGAEWAKGFSKASMERPRIWLRAESSESSRAADFEGWAEPGPVSGSYGIQEGQAAGLTRRPGFETGHWMVQDLSSQWLIQEVARSMGTAPGRVFKALDLCAAPGGKSVGLAWSGFQVVSTDLAGTRFQLLEETLKRTRASARAVARAEAVAAKDYDLVWVDAPCSGSGILRRHPDVRWLREEQDLASLRPTQLGLLKEAATCVRPGGYLAYTVCSVLKEEGEQVVAAAELAGFERVWEKLLSPQDELGGDGFWGCLLKRKPS